MPDKKILVLGTGQYARPFAHLGDITLVNPMKWVDDGIGQTIKYDLVVFTGGEDVSPMMYGYPFAHANTHSNIPRDMAEKSIYNLCLLYRIPKVGICRGAQFLTVMNYGQLVQDCSNHAISGTHMITTQDKRSLPVTSTHHQMMVPGAGSEILAYAEGLSDRYENGSNQPYRPILPTINGKIFKEPEVVWHPLTRSLAVQYHPEYMDDESEGWKYFQHLLEEYVL